MPALLLPLLSFFKTKAGLYVLGTFAFVVAGFLFIEHERGVGAEHALAKAEAATQTESTRRLDAERRIHAQAQEHADTVTAMGASYATSITALAHASHANDGNHCMSLATSNRMRAVDPGGRKGSR